MKNLKLLTEGHLIDQLKFIGPAFSLLTLSTIAADEVR